MTAWTFPWNGAVLPRTNSWIKSEAGVLAVFLVVSAIFLFGAINPYMSQSDEVFYKEGAASLAQGQGYTFHGELVGDWPPVYPVILTAWFWLFGESWEGAKVVTCLIFLAGVAATWVLLKRERRPYPLFACILLALMPAGILTTPRIGSGSTYYLFTILFLLVLDRMREERTWRLALTAGLLLGLASLTRYTGVLLGAAIVFQMGQRFFSSRGPILPRLLALRFEATAAVLGAVMFLTWFLYVMYQSKHGQVFAGNYESGGLFEHFNLTQLFLAIANTFTPWSPAFRILGLGDWWTKALSWIPGLLLGLGIYATIRRGAFKASDAYVLVLLALYATYQWKIPRFILLIAPFLIVYWAEAFHFLARQFRDLNARAWAPRLRLPFAGLWVAAYLGISCIVLFVPGVYHLHGAMSPIVSTSWDKYYNVSPLKEYMGACHAITVHDFQESGIVTSHAAEIIWFATWKFDERFRIYPREAKVKPWNYYILALGDDAWEPGPSAGLPEIYRNEKFRVVYRAPTPPASRPRP